ncbi:alkaline phosphatase PhoX [Roseovarius sp. EL26]|uniref:alkaline phosphatase PhoX n=1 Tax=Roseovarius sp. EL26 TaxID=2126672 RepID=UPI0020B14FCB|nr:alkaline phosphatase PhoX [Roseovarius sp. EL26]
MVITRPILLLGTFFALAENPNMHDGAYAGLGNVNSGNMFNSPDGISFYSAGMLWIQADGKYSNEGDFAGMGNYQMLVGDTNTRKICRFLVGPRESEVKGICWSADRRVAFVGIQHSGEKGDSHFPKGGNTFPRSAIITVTRKDGGLIG